MAGGGPAPEIERTVRAELVGGVHDAYASSEPTFTKTSSTTPHGTEITTTSPNDAASPRIANPGLRAQLRRQPVEAGRLTTEAHQHFVALRANELAGEIAADVARADDADLHVVSSSGASDRSPAGLMTNVTYMYCISAYTTRAEAVSKTRPGRPRDELIDAHLLEVTRRHLAEYGYAAMSLVAIAEEAGTTRPTIYRRWPTKADLAAAAVAALADASTPPVSDDPYADLCAELTSFRRGISRPTGSA